MSVQEDVRAFLASGPFAVVGASHDRSKYGNKVLRAYLQRGLPVYAVNPNADEVEGQRAWPDLASLPEAPRSVSIVTQPEISERVVEQAADAGAVHVWLQPGAESATAVARARARGLGVLHGGPCVLVALGYRDEERAP